MTSANRVGCLTEFFPRQLDLGCTAARTTSVEKFLTGRMKDRLKDEAADPEKRKKRDAGNCLLAHDLDKLVGEESKTTSRLSQVGLARIVPLNPLLDSTFAPLVSPSACVALGRLVWLHYTESSRRYLTPPQVVRQPLTDSKDRVTEKRAYSNDRGGDYGGSKDKRAKAYRWVHLLTRPSGPANTA